MAEEYYQNLSCVQQAIEVTCTSRREIDFYQGIEETCRLIQAQAAAGHKLMLIGNGASAAIASHMATDFWKNGGVRALAFNDGSLLTCVGNDFGYEQVFAKPIDMFADPGDILLAISSSGTSRNILLGVNSARERNCRVVTFSGFKPDNPLRTLGDFNFYVPAESYGPVEILHQAIVHCLLDVLNQFRDNQKFTP